MVMKAELEAAGCDVETAKIVAEKLERYGYILVRTSDIGWPQIHAFQDELRRGQDIYEDGGGFFVRCILALLGRRKQDSVTTYRCAADALIRSMNK
jgi:hypothetical protein